jgi:ABC-type oligopeptide transport system substrate-binding subunit
MKNKKIVALILVLVMATTALASCFTPAPPADPTYEDPYAKYTDYDEKSQKIYDDILGEFYTAYEAAKAETNVSKRYALMAIAEAKLMEAAVMLPIYSNGGNYAISRVAPNTAPFALWGNDSYRYHSILVATNPITSEDRGVMKAKWAELKGTGEYVDWAVDFLEQKGYELKDNYTLIYTSDPSNWDVLATSKAVDSEALVNTYDGLVEYDAEGNLLPALAESWSVSDDGLQYTFKIREGAIWTDVQGNKVADVKADDFVAGFQHMLAAAGGLEYHVQGLIVNADEYLRGTVTDFSQVGVSANADTNEVTYTLCQPTSYFLTYLGYGVFAPMSRDYYTSKGGRFGAEYDAAADTYQYAKGPDSIAYCGPYTVSSNTEKNSIVFSKSESYWNKDSVTMNTITWLYDDGQDVLRGYNDMKKGDLDGAGLNASALVEARKDLVPGTNVTYFDKYVYISATDATSFMAFFNVNRESFANYNDSAIPSPKSEADQERAIAALRNASFRRALAFSIDRASYNAQGVGEDLKLNALRNSYTPGNFVYLTEEVTVKIGGADKTYGVGTAYGQIMQDQINADGVKIKVWDPNGDGGAGSSDGFDGWYNVENAKAELAKAIEELAAIGIEVSAENPIYIDLPTLMISATWKNKANALKQSVEAALEGKVKINLVECNTADEWYFAGYDTYTGDQANYDIYDLSGWGPDYGDPQTYLDTFLPAYMGYMTKCIGIF